MILAYPLNDTFFVQQCKRFCLFDAVRSDCSCFHPLYLDIDTIRGGFPPCDLNDSEVETCVENIFTQFNEELRRCNCNATCSELSYDSVPSSSLWPSKQYEKTAESNYGFGDSAPTPAGR